MGRRRRCVVGSDAGSPESKRQKLSDDEPLLDTLVSVPLEPAAAASEAPLLPRTPASSCTDVPAPAITLNGGAVPKVEMDVKDVKEESAEFKSETSTPRPEHSRNLMKVMAMPNPPPPIPSGPPAYKTAWGRSAEVPVMEDSPSPSPSHRRKKRHVVTEEHIEPINQWWANESSKDDGRQWSYLEHKGIVFGKPYEPHERPLKVMGVDVILPPEAEEAASFWCNAVESEYGTKEKFIRNFWADFLASLPVDHPIVTGVGFEHTVQFEDCDFSEMLNFFKARKEEETFRKKKLTSDEKRAEAAARQLVDGPNATCLYDGLREKVGAFKAEPPSLFRGRGAHPKMGKLKK
ncbi:MAG: uncharacterized protein KVP18_001574 [Porospora cf. gigantea A]|nr:MAG: hypothetical protein KVP18_001574 [Porospora cf. gigantea A]